MTDTAAPSKRDYRKTLNLPKTDFPMRAELPKREPAMVEWWKAHGTYQKRLDRNRESGAPWILHDGPPYANGELHMGHFLNRFLKDAFIKIHLLDGEWADFIPGWDMHGLPIELETLRHLKLDFHHVDPIELREKCRDRALFWLDKQRATMLRMGVFGHYDRPYRTIDPSYEETIVETLADLAERDQMYKNLRPTLWCLYDETALAEAEIEYKDRISAQIYVHFPATPVQKEDMLLRFGASDVETDERLSVVCWTTTPWSMPGVVGVAFNAEAEYGLYRVLRDGVSQLIVVATALADDVFGRPGGVTWERIASVPGAAMLGGHLQHPFQPFDVELVVADYVMLDTGSGAVTTAPGHGPDDFATGQRFGLPTLSPVDDQGRFTADAGPYAGLVVFDANPKIVEDLARSGVLWFDATYEHSYPHCWRCKNPVIYRATQQWFIGMDRNGLRERVVAEVPQVGWIPPWGETRMRQMIENHPEWCVSRQRTWGTPIPAVQCIACGTSVLDAAVARKAAAIFGERGANAWWTDDVGMFLPEEFACAHCGGTEFRKEMNIVDIWFESGVSNRAVLGRNGIPWPSDAVLEGSDQYRGWFRSPLILSVATKGTAPYKQVVSTGWVVDADGRAMHKSAGNYIGALDAMEKYGADVLRLWVCSVEYTADVRLGVNLLENVGNVYRNFRNRLRWLLGVIEDLTPEDLVPVEQMAPFDRLAVNATAALAARVVEQYRSYRLHEAYLALVAFDTESLSRFYVDALKEPLYTEARDSVRRRSGQSAAYTILTSLLALLAPVLSFTAEEAWQHVPAALRGERESVFDLAFPRDAVDEAELGEWETLKALRAQVAASEVARDLAAAAHVRVPRAQLSAMRALGDNLREALIVSQVDSLDVAPDGAPAVTIQEASGEKCARCWKYRDLGVEPEHPTLCADCAKVVTS